MFTIKKDDRRKKLIEEYNCSTPLQLSPSSFHDRTSNINEKDSDHCNKYVKSSNYAQETSHHIHFDPDKRLTSTHHLNQEPRSTYAIRCKNHKHYNHYYPHHNNRNVHGFKNKYQPPTFNQYLRPIDNHHNKQSQSTNRYTSTK